MGLVVFSNVIHVRITVNVKDVVETAFYGEGDNFDGLRGLLCCSGK